MELKDFFNEHKKIALAFSGGLDSSFLMYAAKKYAENVKAYYVKTAFQPEFEYKDAVRMAGEIGVELEVVNMDILSNQDIVVNNKDRCYYCKRMMMETIVNKAKADGYDEVMDGTNASDNAKERAGMKVLGELGILSPLKICGITKADIKERAKKSGLFTWNKPPYACLATRIPTGCEIEDRLLRRTEMAERYMRKLGFTNFRVRDHYGLAKIQIMARQLPLFIEKKKEIYETLKQDYDGVCLDLEDRYE